MDVHYASVAMPAGCFAVVYDVATGAQLERVVEASADEGWIKCLLFVDGRPIVIRFERKIRLVIPDTAPQFAREAFAYANAMLSDT